MRYSASRRAGDISSIKRAWHNSPAQAGRTTVQHIADYERQRRHATLVAISLDLLRQPDRSGRRPVRPAGRCHVPQGRGRHARAFQADARAINEKVRLYARGVGAALIAARDDKQDAYQRDHRIDAMGEVPHDCR